MMQLTSMPLEDAEGIVGRPSNLLLNDEGNVEDDHVLVRDANEDLLKEIDELLSDLKLQISCYIKMYSNFLC
jgi:hypothetical protein